MLLPMYQLPMELPMDQAKTPRSRLFLTLDASDASDRPSRVSQHQWQRH
jgi:hypothetical protein